MAVGASNAAADAELAARDRPLRGLDVVLDDERLGAVLGDALPGAGVTAVQATYVRYKPGTACIVACRLSVAGERLDAYVRLERAASRDKLVKHAGRADAPSRLGQGAVMLPEMAAALYPLPNDRAIAALADLADDRRRRRLLTKMLPERAELWSSSLEPLRWKPERRFVGALCGADGGRALVKAYAGRFAAAHRAAKALGGRASPRTPQYLGRSRRNRVIVFGWLPGEPLAGDRVLASAERAGAALAELQRIAPPRLPRVTRDGELQRVLRSVETVSWLMPEARATAQRLAQQIARRLPRDERPVVAHGDFSADQLLADGEAVAIVDLDEAVLSHPARDLGSFAASLGREVVAGRLAADAATAAQAGLLAGYGSVDPDPLRAWTAAALLRLAPEPFRHREPDWPARVRELLAMAEAVHER